MYIEEMYAFPLYGAGQAQQHARPGCHLVRGHAPCPYGLYGVPTKYCLVARVIRSCLLAWLVRFAWPVRSDEFVLVGGMITAAQRYALLAIDGRGDGCEYCQVRGFIDVFA